MEELHKKPKVNEVAAILFEELFNNEGMTIVGKVEKALPKIDNLIIQSQLDLLERLEESTKDAIDQCAILFHNAIKQERERIEKGE